MFMGHVDNGWSIVDSLRYVSHENDTYHNIPIPEFMLNP